MATFLTRDDILKVQDLKVEEVPVPEWGGVVLVQGLSGTGRDDYEQTIVVQKGKDTRVNMRNARAKLVALSVVDEQGRRLFSDADVSALGKKSAAALQRVFNVASRLSGISDEDLKELTEELEESPFEGSASA
jgi:hypothetical protein